MILKIWFAELLGSSGSPEISISQAGLYFFHSISLKAHSILITPYPELFQAQAMYL